MNNNFEYIKTNIDNIKYNIEVAAEKSGRSLNDILFLAVTKTVDIDRIKVAVDCGLKDLGENRVQELVQKYEILNSDCNWHLIGHLQTNKIKYIIDKVKLIHSVDSENLALEINKQAKKNNKIVDILVEINIADEATKFGIKPEDTEEIIIKLSNLSNINIKG